LRGLGPDALAYRYGAISLSIVVINGIDTFESGCLMAQPQNMVATNDHPEGGYNISYPYCRTAIRYRMDDERANPQIAQVVALAPTVSIKIILDGCDPSDIISVSNTVAPPQTQQCGASLYPGYTKTQFFLVVEVAAITLPARFYFTLTNSKGVTRTFWIGIRSDPYGPASGTVV